MCLFSRRDIHAGIGENGRQPIDPSAASWDEMRVPYSLAALRDREAAPLAQAVRRTTGGTAPANDRALDASVAKAKTAGHRAA